MILHTQRLTLLPTTSTDFEMIHEILTDAYVRKYLCDDLILPQEQIQEFLQTSIDLFASKSFGLWLIQHTDLKKIIGLAGLWYFFEESQPQLLYALLPAYTGEGFATEASQEIIRYSFQELGFPYLIASCDTPNASSHKVALRLGMQKVKEEIINDKPLTFYQLDNR